VRISCTIEWLGHKAGWHAAAEYRGRTITVTQQKSFSLARRRLRAALEGAGVPNPDLQITARMPKAIETDLARYNEVAKQIPELTNELEGLKMKVAQRLCNELNFSEREVGIWLGVSGAHISAKLRALSIDTRPARDDEDDGDGGTEPVRPTAKSR
jgi:hypothetical protein